MVFSSLKLANLRARYIFFLVVIICDALHFSYAADIEFNSDVLDLEDRSNIDLGQFSRAGYIMPGDYVMAIHLNSEELRERSVTFYPPPDDPGGSQACLSPALVEQLGLKPEVSTRLVWWHDNGCLDLTSIPGVTTRGDLGSSALYVNIPQVYLEYASESWDPPSRWDNGISGLLVDYSFNAQNQRRLDHGRNSSDITGYGVVGANMGAWRLRADWQARFDEQGSARSSNQKNLDWNRFYAYRALPGLGAQFMVGENYLDSNIFDSFRFAGATLATDDSMLPPNLRGYAPEVSGVAQSNAKVTVSQQGRVLYETQVAPGPFRIQDINDAVTGQLTVRVEEQNGSVQEFQVETANIPYLTRPGMVRYKASVGRPSDYDHRINGPTFGAGEFSWGVSNGWSLYGGGIGGGNYAAGAIGVGRDLMQFGALSFDVTQSSASLGHEAGNLSGRSYRLSYSKSFDEYDSQVNFAGYRFSERDFMSMSDYLDAEILGTRLTSNKEMYTATFSKQFRDQGLSIYFNYGRQTYWDQAATDRYNLTLSRYFDLGQVKNLSASFTASRSIYNGISNDSFYLSVSLPLDGSASLSYSGSVSGRNVTHQASYYDRLDEHDSYRISAGNSVSGSSASGYYSHDGDLTQSNFSASYEEGSYTSLGLSVQGGATATPEGAALHRSGSQGGTRMLLDTDGVADVPVRGYGPTIQSNRFGKAVVPDVSSYYRNKLSVDIDALPDNVEATGSVAQATLTEGAIGYGHFEVVAGEKAMVTVRLDDGSTPPFGATVTNAKNKPVGIVSDSGSLYLSGIQAGAAMSVSWAGEVRCVMQMPQQLPSTDQEWSLVCHKSGRNGPGAALAAKR